MAEGLPSDQFSSARILHSMASVSLSSIRRVAMALLERRSLGILISSHHPKNKNLLPPGQEKSTFGTETSLMNEGPHFAENRLW